MSSIEQELAEIRQNLQPQITEHDVLGVLGYEPGEIPEPANEVIPQPTDNRSPLQRVKAAIESFDATYCSWADTKTGQVIASLIIVFATCAAIGLLIYPNGAERQKVYQKGYQDCKARVEAGLQCL